MSPFTVKNRCRNGHPRTPENWDGRRCRACARESQRRRREANPAYMREWRRANIHKDREYHFKSRYGITLEQYQQMLEAQNGVCAICEQPETAPSKWGTIRELGVDHCHRTREVRGLLCHSCNVAVGLLGDDPDRFLRALRYLEER